MPLINCDINLSLARSNRCFVIDNPIGNQEPKLTMTDIKLYVLVVTQHNAKLLEKLKSGFKIIINWSE